MTQKPLKNTSPTNNQAMQTKKHMQTPMTISSNFMVLIGKNRFSLERNDCQTYRQPNK
jgi:hypothetical protein